jgi:hypothetical protein
LVGSAFRGALAGQGSSEGCGALRSASPPPFACVVASELLFDAPDPMRRPFKKKKKGLKVKKVLTDKMD